MLFERRRALVDVCRWCSAAAVFRMRVSPKPWQPHWSPGSMCISTARCHLATAGLRSARRSWPLPSREACRDWRSVRLQADQGSTTMCLGVPGKVIDVNGLIATVDFWGVRKQVRLEVVDEPVQPGDYILNHVGYAIRRIPDAEIDATLALYEELLARAESEDDLMAADIRGEIHGAGDDH